MSIPQTKGELIDEALADLEEPLGPGGPSRQVLINDGHLRNDCPSFSGVGIMGVQSTSAQLLGQAGQMPLAVVVCLCGVIKSVPLMQGRGN